MQLRHRGAFYEFEYDFVPNDGIGDNVCTMIGARWLDGQIRITDVHINGWPGPVSEEAMGLMWKAAAIDRLDWQT